MQKNKKIGFYLEFNMFQESLISCITSSKNKFRSSKKAIQHVKKKFQKKKRYLLELKITMFLWEFF